MRPILQLFCYLILSQFIFAEETKIEQPQKPKSYKGPSTHTINLKQPAITSIDENGIEWRMWYIAKGTRSQGLHGILNVDNEPIEGKVLYEKKQISGRTFIWYGTWDSRKNLFSSSGWLPEDFTKWKTRNTEIKMPNKSQ